MKRVYSSWSYGRWAVVRDVKRAEWLLTGEGRWEVAARPFEGSVRRAPSLTRAVIDCWYLLSSSSSLRLMRKAVRGLLLSTALEEEGRVCDFSACLGDGGRPSLAIMASMVSLVGEA